MTQPIISVRSLSKKYRIGRQEVKSDTVIGTILNTIISPIKNFRDIRSMVNLDNDHEDIFWALQDISFDVYQGDVLGVIGHNGAGKSTLLKILSRITEPSTGEAVINGRVSSLLEVGTGFHPELTGRENVYMNGTILGMSRKEIDSKFEEIIDFSGISMHIHTPVKFYSSGMKVRLGFAVAAHLEPEILIIDEVLAVGDTEFQSKCLGKMKSAAKSGRTVIFVSHDLGAVQSLCPKAILLHKGKLTHYDKSDIVVNGYLNKSLPAENVQDFTNRFGNGNVTILAVNLVDEERPVAEVQTGQKCFIEISYTSSYQKQLPSFSYFHIFCKSHTGAKLFTLSSKYASSVPGTLSPTGKIKCCIESLPLLPGNYYLDVCCKLSDDTEDYINDALKVTVISGRFPGYSRLPNSTAGVFLVEQSWSSK